ncbi:MAG: lipase maturation factor family protein [Vicinamibacteria bacterium]
MTDRPVSDRSYWLTRFLFLRMLGLVYTVAFLVVVNQWMPLLGSHGLLPAGEFLDRIAASRGRDVATFFQLPTLFWLDASDAAFRACGFVGLGLSLAVLAGFANVPILAALWLLYMSFVHVGQIFYGYGWETLLLETGFLAIFLAPLGSPGPFPRRTPTPAVVIVLLRWLIFRVMLGAGLIKLRGDSCWRDLTCLVYHYETQPNPNPLSWYLHQLPVWFHEIEVAFNHVVELLAPFFVFGPRRARHVAGGLIVLFQVLLILSGNLSFLNWLTITVAVACFDDGLLERVVPPRVRAWIGQRTADARETRARGIAVYVLAAVVALLSLNPAMNLLSPAQRMNTAYDPFDLVNSYGAFGSIGRERYEIVLEGTDEAAPTDEAHWVEYDFPCKPGDTARRPCWISPYHYRLDWQMWFAAMPGAGTEPWLAHLVAKLLQGDAATRGLLAPGPFQDRPPRFIRASYYRYEFTRMGEAGWWRRKLASDYLPPLSADSPELMSYLARHGW